MYYVQRFRKDWESYIIMCQRRPQGEKLYWIHLTLDYLDDLSI